MFFKKTGPELCQKFVTRFRSNRKTFAYWFKFFTNRMLEWSIKVDFNFRIFQADQWKERYILKLSINMKRHAK